MNKWKEGEGIVEFFKILATPHIVSSLIAIIVFVLAVRYFTHAWWNIDFDNTISEVEYIPPTKVHFKILQGRDIRREDLTEILSENLFWKIAKDTDVEVLIQNKGLDNQNISLYVSFDNDKDIVVHKLKFMPKPAVDCCDKLLLVYGAFASQIKDDRIVFYCKWHKAPDIIATILIFIASLMVTTVAWGLSMLITSLVVIWKINRQDT